MGTQSVNKNDVYGLIIAGGSGTRLWPESRARNPKQFLPLGREGKTLLQETFSRLCRSVSPMRLKIVTHHTSAWHALSQARALSPTYPETNIMGEPQGRDSAAAIYWGALSIAEENPHAVVVVEWSDQVIGNNEAFDQALEQGIEVAGKGTLVALGVTPTKPDTSLGYMQVGEKAHVHAQKVDAFLEKPNSERAQKYLKKGGFLWNAGIFIFHVGALLEEFAKYANETTRAFNSQAHLGANWLEPERIEKIYHNTPNGSLDHLVLEKTKNLLAIPCDLEWRDMGAWDVVFETMQKDDSGNAVMGNAIALSSVNTLIRAGKRLVTTLGVKDLVVVDTDDALLVCDIGWAQEVKKLVEHLRVRNIPEADQPAREQRPWGSFVVLEEGPGFKVKLIEVKPGAKLSLQSHKHRAEHWVVAQGEVYVTRDDAIDAVATTGFIQIEQGMRHRMDNRGEIPAKIIEVQFGNYLGEDDITRYEDDYGRG